MPETKEAHEHLLPNWPSTGTLGQRTDLVCRHTSTDKTNWRLASLVERTAWRKPSSKQGYARSFAVHRSAGAASCSILPSPAAGTICIRGSYDESASGRPNANAPGVPPPPTERRERVCATERAEREAQSRDAYADMLVRCRTAGRHEHVVQTACNHEHVVQNGLLN